MDVIALGLFLLVGFVMGWVLPDNPARWTAVLLPVVLALATAIRGDLAIVLAILGIGLTAAAVVAGRALAQRVAAPAR